MEKPTKAEVQRILGALKRSKKKMIGLEALSRLMGRYPEVLCDTLAYFEPLIRMDPSINVRDLTPQLEAYLEEPMKPKKERPTRKPVRKAELTKYSSIADFVLHKLTSVGGLVDPTIRLSDEDLAILERLIQLEEKKRKKKQ